MPAETVTLPNAAELRVEAGEARFLASMLGNAASASDLLAYAAALEADANCCEALSHSRGASIAGDRAAH